MIRASGLRKRYRHVAALDDVSLHVPAGEAIALLGPNGSGKTTLLKSLAGLVRPDAGTVRIADHLVSVGSAAGRLVGIVPQRPVFPRHARVQELLAFAASLRGLPEGAEQSAMERLELSEAASRVITELSGGMQQRVAIAQALLGDPPVLLLDEPTTGLDPASAHTFRHLLMRLRTEGKTIVISTHLLDEVEQVADRIAMMKGGRLVGCEARATLKKPLVEVYMDWAGVTA